ncbi:M20 aminoacylase family protein [Acidisphaera sp. L21]|uniref:M20 aminoacylase family protein n=1 Tax=Acidisphaera sp. L21 TaxID=1641851 RepID=UPI00131E0A72|nr:M20 aminoacylase family protein [Acidisphaera sp. L21]
MTDSPASPDLDTRLAKALPELIALRQDIHTHPELGLEEERTAALVAAKLRSFGIDVTEGVGGYGVVGTLRGKRPGQGAIGLRADMDALSLTETTGLPYASATPGKMHACGHDGHTTMLLGAAQMLSQSPDFAGTVHFIFQPAEEGRGGAKAMLADKLFERFPCDAVYGMHNIPGIPVGNFALRKGPLMAGSGRWVVTFRGTGGHGGNSAHISTDVTVVLASFIQALQSIVSRNVAATETAVISVGHIAGGSPHALNVMPSEMVIGGTMRAFNPQTQALLDKRMTEVAELTAATQGVTAEVNLRWGAAPLLNHDAQTDSAISAAARVTGEQNVDPNTTPITAGEDFAFMLQAKPGAFIFIGNGDEAEGPVHGLHTPNYNFNDKVLPTGVRYWVELVQQELATL